MNSPTPSAHAVGLFELVKVKVAVIDRLDRSPPSGHYVGTYHGTEYCKGGIAPSAAIPTVSRIVDGPRNGHMTDKPPGGTP